MEPAKFSISGKAEEDLEAVYLYSLENWGEVKADGYIQLLGQAFQQLGENPSTGVSCDFIRKGLYMYPAQSHSIFYRIKSQRVVVVRVLHKSMLAGKHL